MMHGLTIHQPFAGAITLGDSRKLGTKGKLIENRTWPPPKQLIGKHFAIHAGKKAFEQLDAIEVGRMLYGSDCPLAQWQQWIGWLTAGAGTILSVAKLSGFTSGALPEHQQRWKAPGHIAWQLEDVRELAVPIQFRGLQGLWSVPSGLEQQIRDQVGL